MHCRNCEYQLWNLRERRCPECGIPFAPSEYDFVVNSVQFCCPHCEQVYYGTGERGHLDPQEFDCVSCPQRVRMDDMVLRPAPGFEDADTAGDVVPWLERDKRGRFKAWFSTIGMALVGPVRLMQAHRSVVSGGQAWWFAVVTNLVVLTVGFLPLFAFQVALIIVMMRGAGPGSGMFLSALPFLVPVLLGMAVVSILMLLFLIFIWGLVTQGILRLVAQPEGDLSRTYEALCYSSGTNAIAAVPVCGAYLASIGSLWWIVSAVLMVKERQQVRGGQAALAVLTLPCIAALGLIVVFVGMLWFGVNQTQPFAMNAVAGSSTEEVQLIVVGVREYAEAHEGNGPGHAVELVGGGYLDSYDLVASNSMTYESDVPVVDATLEAYAAWPRPRQRRAEQVAASAVPVGAIAHRLGDFVFTYHGFDLRDADARLWIVIESWDPDAQMGAVGIQETRIAVGIADGTVTEFDQDQLAAKLTEQNALRETLGLPPLPRPRAVRHGKPAVAEPVNKP